MVAEESSFFAKLTNEVLRATEQVTNTLEDGISLLLKGELSQQGGSNNDKGHGGNFGGNDNNMDNPMMDDELFADDEEDPMMGSPLEGIANSVLGDIMSNQVRSWLLCVLRVFPRPLFAIGLVRKRVEFIWPFVDSNCLFLKIPLVVQFHKTNAM